MDDKLRGLLRKYKATEDPLDAIAFAEASLKKETKPLTVCTLRISNMQYADNDTVLLGFNRESCEKQLVDWFMALFGQPDCGGLHLIPFAIGKSWVTIEDSVAAKDYSLATNLITNHLLQDEYRFVFIFVPVLE